MKPSRAGTVAFLKYCKKCDWNADPLQVRVFIQDRLANPNAPITYNQSATFLHEFAQRGLLECIKEYLETPFDIDFTLQQDSCQKYTVLHLLCDYHIPNEVAVGMLKSILFRIQTHPGDLVDWSLRARNGFDFLSHAAYQERLSLFWPLVRDMPFYADQIEPINLCSWIWEWDLEKLGEGVDFQEFQDSHKIVKANRPTVFLIRLCLEKDWYPDEIPLDEVQRYVVDGADVNFRGPGRENSILQEFIARGNVAHAKLCLTSDRAISFSTPSPRGRTILYTLCETQVFMVDGKSQQEAAGELLQMFIEHANTHFDDKLDWGKTRKNALPKEGCFGQRFLDTVVRHGKLSLFWPILQASVSFYGHQKTITLSSPVQKEDWDKLSAKNQKHFVIKFTFL